MDHNPWSHKELDMTEQLRRTHRCVHTHIHISNSDRSNFIKKFATPSYIDLTRASFQQPNVILDSGIMQIPKSMLFEDQATQTLG